MYSRVRGEGEFITAQRDKDKNNHAAERYQRNGHLDIEGLLTMGESEGGTYGVDITPGWGAGVMFGYQ